MSQVSSRSEPSIGVIGLGAMGAAMVSALADAGRGADVYDLSETAMERAAQTGITPRASARDVIAGAEVIILSLPTAAHVATTIETALAKGAFDTGSKIIVDTSTSEAPVSRDLAARLAPLGHVFLDAPISGGPAAAARGELSMMIGGDTDGVNRAMPVLEALSARVVHVGPSGTGNVAKLVNNMLVACHMITTREALRLAHASDVSPEDVLRVVNTATGRSAISEIHYPTWVLTDSYDSGFSTGLMRKDLRLALELGAGLDLPMAELAGQLWDESRSGLSDSDDFMLMGRPTSEEPLDPTAQHQKEDVDA